MPGNGGVDKEFLDSLERLYTFSVGLSDAAVDGMSLVQAILDPSFEHDSQSDEPETVEVDTAIGICLSSIHSSSCQLTLFELFRNSRSRRHVRGGGAHGFAHHE
jgi:hypothetical protein